MGNWISLKMVIFLLFSNSHKLLPKKEKLNSRNLLQKNTEFNLHTSKQQKSWKSKSKKIQKTNQIKKERGNRWGFGHKTNLMLAGWRKCLTPNEKWGKCLIIMIQHTQFSRKLRLKGKYSIENWKARDFNQWREIQPYQIWCYKQERAN